MTQAVQHNYAPLDPSEYVIETIDRCEVRSLMALPEPFNMAAWNLFWLSNPTLDAMPMLGRDWWRHYQPITKEIHGRVVPLIKPVVEDVYKDTVLQRKLMMHPRRFYEWWRHEDATIYDTYQVLGEQWHATVLRRAQLSAETREAGSVNDVKLNRQGNVIYPARWLNATKHA